MKQRISVDQLLELTSEQREKLRSLWNPENGDYIFVELNSGDVNRSDIGGYLHSSGFFDYDPASKLIWSFSGYEHASKMFPLFSIGQMIELLLINNLAMSLTENICDELWRAVKSIL